MPLLTRLTAAFTRLPRRSCRKLHSRHGLSRGHLYYWTVLLSLTVAVVAFSTLVGGTRGEGAADPPPSGPPQSPADQRSGRALFSEERRLHHNHNQITPMHANAKPELVLVNRLSLQSTPHKRVAPHFVPHPSKSNHLILNRLPSDLTQSAQTLYDLRGFHIPLGGQEETQRYLRQQNELEQQQQQRSKPLVFPSFFQPQSNQYQEQNPQSVNIFGHNQHHQQTNRFILGPQPGTESRDVTFRPSQPDLSLTTSTENAFKPVVQQQPSRPSSSDGRNNQVGNQAGKGVDDFVYVYDELDYDDQENQELEKVKSTNSPSSPLRSNQPTAVVIESTTTAAAPQQQTRNQQVLLNQNQFELDPPRRPSSLLGGERNENFYIRQEGAPFHASNPFGREPQQQVLIEPHPPPPPPQYNHQPHHPGPRVEIVPSSERKPPPDQSNAIHENVRLQRPPPPPTTAIIYSQEQQLNEHKPSIRFQPPSPPTQHQQQNYLNNEIQYFNRNQQQQRRPFVIGHDFNSQFVVQQDPITENLQNPTRDLLHPPPRLVTSSVFPQRFINVSPTPPSHHRDQYVIDEGQHELVEVYREQTTTTTTEAPPTTTTLKPFRRNPFPPRHRLVPTARSTTTTTTAAPRRRGVRPRVRPTEPPLLDLSDNYVLVSDEEDDLEPVKIPGIVKLYESDGEEIRTFPRRSRVQVTPTTPTVRQRPIQQYNEEDVNQFNRHKPTDTPQLVVTPFVVQSPALVQSLQESLPSQRQQHHRHRIPPVKSTGKPLYLNAADKEGGLYSDYIIPIGHIYGSPIPFLPINQVLDRMPGLFEEIPPRGTPNPVRVHHIEKTNNNNKRVQVNHRDRDRVRASTVSTVAVTRQTTTPRSTTSTTSRPLQPFSRGHRNNHLAILESETNKPAAAADENSIGGRPPPLRRRIKPRPTAEVAPLDPTTPSPARRFVPETRKSSSYKSNPILRSTPVQVPSIEVSLPITPKPNPLKRRARIRVTQATTTTTTTSSTTAPPPSFESSAPNESSFDEESPKPLRRKVIKKQRPRAKVQRQDEQDEAESDEPVTYRPVYVPSKKPTEPPERFSSRFRDDENDRPLEVVEITPPTQPIRLTKPHKKIKEPPPRPTPRQIKPSSAQEEEDSGELPPTVRLRPKDVLVNRKPARRIPPGSASDKLKALQEKRRNLLNNRFSPRTTKPAIAQSTPKTTAATTARKRLDLEPTNEEEEENVGPD